MELPAHQIEMNDTVFVQEANRRRNFGHNSRRLPLRVPPLMRYRRHERAQDEDTTISKEILCTPIRITRNT